MIQNSETISGFKIKHEFFKDSLLPSTIHGWNELDLQIENSQNINIFKKQHFELYMIQN